MINCKLGSNATLAERIEHDPASIDFDELISDVEELAEWRELLDLYEYTPDDVAERIKEDKDRIEELEGEVEELEATLRDALSENEELKSIIADLEEQML